MFIINEISDRHFAPSDMIEKKEDAVSPHILKGRLSVLPSCKTTVLQKLSFNK